MVKILTCTVSLHSAFRNNHINSIHILIVIFSGLLRDDNDVSSKRNYVYYLGVAHARLKQYDTALGYIDILLEIEEGNDQAKRLKEAIKSAMTHDGLIGAAIVGGGALALAGLVAIFTMSRK
ncbi:hypothetical protein B9Z55_025558 [Caenorhabditis nigoni]|uniref:Mitochondrial fission 1 protein n=1 Tax=Caenorhabditis nigoni TaxID=1611254 RepID=A0A2G5SYX3_9PELO|nr:hypothetical protein B9Z55_025558 [Caenorhabditis nigoni]